MNLDDLSLKNFYQILNLEKIFKLQLMVGEEHRYEILQDGELQIVNTRRTDSGIYKCIANNGVGLPAEHKTRLIVTGTKNKIRFPQFIIYM